MTSPSTQLALTTKLSICFWFSCGCVCSILVLLGAQSTGCSRRVKTVCYLSRFRSYLDKFSRYVHWWPQHFGSQLLVQTDLDWIPFLGKRSRGVSALQEKLLAELTPELSDRVQYAEVSCVEEKNGKYRILAHFSFFEHTWLEMTWRSCFQGS